MRILRAFVLPAALLVLPALTAVPALSQPRPVRIEQAMAGAYGRPEIQFVELRADLCSSSWPAGARLSFRTLADAPAGEFVFPSAPGASCPGPISILVGTPAFAALTSAPDPDFVMPPLLVPHNGRVCLEALAEGLSQCLVYGSFPSGIGAASNAPALPVQPICSLRHNNPIVPLREMSNLDFDLLPPVPANTAGEAGIVTVPPRFQDVPAQSPFHPFVEALFNAGITGGCGAGAFCPDTPVTREQMAVFLSLARQGRQFQPPACTLQVFADVPCSRPLAPWINDFVARGFSGGCGGDGMGNFCPDSPVRRKEMAVFLLLVREGAGFTPPACTVPAFADVPCSDPFAPWVNELAARGITGGCAPGQFCPDGFVRRDQMAVFLSTTFGFPVPSPGCPVPAVPDDHGDSIATATLVPPSPQGILIEGRLERRRDVDFFAFDAQAGDVFTFRYKSGNLVLGTGFQGSIGVLDAAGTILGGISLPELFTFTAPHTGRFFFLMRDAANRAIGDYDLQFRGPIQDDVGTGPGEAVPLTLNAPPLAGQIEQPGDVDAYSFDAVAGELYVVETVGNDPEMQSLLTLLDPLGNIVSQSAAIGPVKSLVVVAPSTASFRVQVSHRTNGQGRYEIRVRGPIVDDHGDTPAAASPLAGGDPATPALGELVPLADVDLFSFSGAAEDVFLLKLESLAPNFATLKVAVLDADGAVLLEKTGWTSSLDRVVVPLPESGTWFIRVARHFSIAEPAPYRLTLTGPVADDHGDTLATATPLTVGNPPTDGLVEIAEDADFFSFPAQAGELFVVEATGATNPVHLDVFQPDGSPLGHTNNGEWVGFVAPSTGTYFARVQRPFAQSPLTYRIQVRGPLTDVGGRPSMSTPLVPNGPPFSSALELRGDLDLYSFAAAAGETVLIRAEGPPSLDTFNNLWVQVLGTDGLTVLTPVATSFLTGRVEVWFRAPQSGTFYARVSGNRTLPYQISLHGPFADDHGNSPAAASPLVVDAPATDGEIEVNPDFDLFFFDASAGQVLIVETSNLGGGLDTILDVLAANGLNQLATDDDGGGGLASRIRFEVPITGRYLVRVRPFGSTAGTYRVSVGEE